MRTERNPPWTIDELILALDLYHRIGWQNIQKSPNEITELSTALNALTPDKDKPNASKFRNQNGVGKKLWNFARFDPTYPGVGLSKGNKLDEDVWNRFYGNLERLHAAALAIRNALTASDGHSLQDVDNDEDDEAYEGKLLLRLHRRRERKPWLVRKKKEDALNRYGVLSCEVCSRSYTDDYGAHADATIECHHRAPLASIGVRKTQPKDLALVCSNCHRVLHRCGLLVEELQKTFQRI
jgi:5-methylcytosine-specific restriction protein A